VQEGFVLLTLFAPTLLREKKTNSGGHVILNSFTTTRPLFQRSATFFFSMIATFPRRSARGKHRHSNSARLERVNLSASPRSAPNPAGKPLRESLVSAPKNRVSFATFCYSTNTPRNFFFHLYYPSSVPLKSGRRRHFRFNTQAKPSRPLELTSS